MAAATMTLTYGATSVTVPTPEYPERPGVDIDQYRAAAMGGAVWTVTRSAGTLYYPVFRWETLNDADFNTLSGFILTTCAGSEHDFTLVDWDSTTWTATYLGGLPEAEQDDYNCWRLSLALKLVAP